MEFGIFSNEGLLEGGFFSWGEAERARNYRYSEDEAHVAVICHDHPEQEAESCEACNTEETEEEEP